MNSIPMSSTTEESDWENNIVPRSRQPSSTSQSSYANPQRQPGGTPQPIPFLPRQNGPGQSVFPVYVRPNFRLENSQNQIPLPQPQLPFEAFVNQIPFPAPSFTPSVAPLNPAIGRVLQANDPRIPNADLQTPATPSTPVYTPPAVVATLNSGPFPQPMAPQHHNQIISSGDLPDAPPEYSAPPRRSIRGVKRGTPRARASTRGRGGRTPKIKVETPDNADPSVTTSASTTATRAKARGPGSRGGRVNRGGRPRGSRAGASSSRGVKRKREDDEEKDDSDVSEIITPLPTQSRSGRKITHASNFAPVVIDLEAKAPASVTAATPKVATNASNETARGRGARRSSRPGAASVCKNCGRGHSPASNMIVFCDGCNAPWHQYCHDPPISSEVIRIEEQEWFCSDCLVLREERTHVDGKVSAEALSVVEKRRYLQSLPPSQLVSLLLHATILHPDLPIFATPMGGPLPERPKRPITHFVDPTAPPEDEDESNDLYPDSEVLPYPKAGNGIPLPRESQFLSLLIDEDVGVYSHVWNWKEETLNIDS